MNRKLKTLGLALVAVMAMSVVAASAAQATNFTAEKYPATLSGSQTGTHVFKAGAAEVTCETATFAGTMAGASETQLIEPTYEKCHAIVLGAKLPATVTKSGTTPCYKFEITGGSGHVWTGAVDIRCTLTVDIFANATTHAENKPLCVITVGPQTRTGITYDINTTATPKVDLDVTANVGSINYTRTGSANCGAASGSNATYVGNTTQRAFSGAEQIGGGIS